MSKRRAFLKDISLSTAGIGLFGAVNLRAEGLKHVIAQSKPIIVPKGLLKFAVIGMNHGHIYGMTEAIKRGGGELKSYFAKEADLNEAYGKRYPEAALAKSEEEILNDPEISLVLSAGIPVDRAPLGIRVMKAGKDYMTDKPGIITLKQMAEVKKVQKATGRIYSIVYSERFENRATVKASELVKEGAIGRVIQTIGTGPHIERPGTRPTWFYDMKKVGGIICDIASHQFDQYLHFTNTTSAKVLAAQVGNFGHPEVPTFEDFGDVMLQGNGGSGYIRVDWFSPKGLDTWGDGRLFIIGTEGYMEIRKNTDVATGKKPGSHLIVVNQKEMLSIDCSQVELPYGPALVQDVLHRTQTAMSQDHCFLATELALKAQKSAIWIA